MPEVDARRLLDAVGAVPEVDRVEVRREDAVFRPLLLQLPRERRLLELALEGAAALHVRVLHELLRDRRAAFDDGAVPQVLPDGTRDAANVDASVLEEAAVLDSHDRLLHDVGDLLGLHDDPRLVSAQHGKHAAVGGVDVGVLVGAVARGIELGQLARDRGHETERERRAADETEHDEKREQAKLADPSSAASLPLRTVSRDQSEAIVPPVELSRWGSRSSRRTPCTCCRKAVWRPSSRSVAPCA